MKTEKKEQKPFFARFIDEQVRTQENVKGGGADPTYKYPSDFDDV